MPKTRNLDHHNKSKMANIQINVDCDFCSVSDCILGFQKFVKVSKKCLKEILEEENGGGLLKKKQKIGHKLMSHHERFLKYIFEFNSGDELIQRFNNLALDKIRNDKGEFDDLGTK